MELKYLIFKNAIVKVLDSMQDRKIFCSGFLNMKLIFENINKLK